MELGNKVAALEIIHGRPKGQKGQNIHLAQLCSSDVPKETEKGNPT